MGERILFTIHKTHAEGDKTTVIQDALLDFNNAGKWLTIRWRENPGDFFSEEYHYSYAELEHIDNYQIIFLVAEQVGYPLIRLFCYYQEFA
jgi:hypothetical protein